MATETVDLETLPAYILDSTFNDALLNSPRKRTANGIGREEGSTKRSKSFGDLNGGRAKKRVNFRYSDMMWDEEMAELDDTASTTKSAKPIIIDLTTEDVSEYEQHLEQAPIPLKTKTQDASTDDRGVQTDTPPATPQIILSVANSDISTRESHAQTEHCPVSTFESRSVQTDIPPSVIASQSILPRDPTPTYESRGVQAESSHTSLRDQGVQTNIAIAAPQNMVETKFGLSAISYIDPSERFVDTKSEPKKLWHTVPEISDGAPLMWNEKEVQTRYALFCEGGQHKKDFKRQLKNFKRAEKVLEFFRVKDDLPTDVLISNRQERMRRIFNPTVIIDPPKTLSKYFEDKSIYSWGGRQLVTRVANCMLSAGENMAMVTHLLWTYEMIYAQLATEWPQIYSSSVSPEAKVTTAALNCLVLATTDGPVDGKLTTLGKAYKNEETLLTSRRTGKTNEMWLFTHFLSEMTAFVASQIAASPQSGYRKDIADIAHATLVEAYITRHRTSVLTMSGIQALFRNDWRAFFLEEIKTAIGDSFESWAETICKPYSDIRPGKLKVDFIKKSQLTCPDIYLPFHLCWQSIKMGVKGANINHLKILKWERQPPGPKPMKSK